MTRAEQPAHLMPLATPVLRTASVSLCPDTSAAVWEQILASPAAVNCFRQASATWRRYLETKLQLPLVLRSFGSVAAVAPFRRVHTLNATDCEWLDSDGLSLLPATLPALQRVDISGCIRAGCIRAMVEGFGSRLLAFAQDVTPKHSTTVVTDVTIESLAASPALQSLSLTLGREVRQPRALEKLTGHRTLQSLALNFLEPNSSADFRGPFGLPLWLPELRHLHLKTSPGRLQGFQWPQGPAAAVAFSTRLRDNSHQSESRFPKIESLTIDDHTAIMQSGLKTQFVFSMACAFLIPITVNHVGTASDIDEALPWVCKLFH